jgi:hypothetical protein
MKKVYTILATILMMNVANAKTYTLGSGKWNDAKVWNGEYTGSTVKADDVVIITGHITVTNPIVVEGTLRIEKGASMVGMRDLTIAKGGKLVNFGNTVMNRIFNEGTIDNNLILEAMNNITNKGAIENNNNMVAGNNFMNFGGNASGKSGAYFVDNDIQTSPNAKFGSDVRIFYGNANETASNDNSANMNLDAAIRANTVVLSVSNPKNEAVAIFAIEKSNDGKNFQLIDMVSNTSTSTMTYTDSKINSNLTYYRVKAISTNGYETTLPVATVKIPFNNALSMAE